MQAQPETQIRTERLLLRRVAPSDAGFLLELLNEPAWLENIGDRGVRTLEDAERYVRSNIVGHYETHGFGVYAVEVASSQRVVGLCGLVQRDYLPEPDLGFALLSAHVNRGYAFEAAYALMRDPAHRQHWRRLYAIVKPGNARSVKLLERLGFGYEQVQVTPAGDEVLLYATP